MNCQLEDEMLSITVRNMYAVGGGPRSEGIRVRTRFNAIQIIRKITLQRVVDSEESQIWTIGGGHGQNTIIFFVDGFGY